MHYKPLNMQILYSYQPLAVCQILTKRGNLFCQRLPIQTTVEDISKVTGDFIRDSHSDWGRCVGIITNVARTTISARKRIALEANSNPLLI
jgi:hypothetical protein